MPTAFLASALIQFALGLVVAWLLGPVEFGFYALALAGAVLAQTLAFEWLRLAATRFYHKRSGPGLGRVLMRWFVALAALLFLAALLLALLGGERRWLLALVPLTAIAAGFADLHAAMLRAAFESRGYALFLALRNGFALAALPAAAALSGRAEPALAAFCLSMIASSAVLVWRMRVPVEPEPENAAEALSRAQLLRYSAPIVATNLAYLGLFFLIRVGIAWGGGMAAAGQASLALDFTLKLFTTAGTAFDLLFFQLAVRDDRERGEEAGQARIASNFQRLLVLIAPMAVGLAFVIARIEPFLVAPEFQGAFAGFVLAAIPGVTAYALVQYGLHPAFQLRQDTGSLLIAAMIAGMAGSVTLGVALGVRAPVLFALAGPILVAMTGAGVKLLHNARLVPGSGFWLRLSAALAGMSLILWGAGTWGDNPATLIVMVVAGAAGYAVIAWIANPGDVRALARGAR